MASTAYDRRFINDPIHGSMGFSSLELQIMETAAFQRLKNIKQLGLVHYVYPTADYSRFAHSLGVCHLAGRFMERLKSLPDTPVGDEEVRNTRLAALTHDVGHYPYSHCFEHAVKNHYRESLTSGGEVTFGKVGAATLKHEEVSKRVLSQDPEISEVLSRHGVDPAEISRRFLREEVAHIGTSVITSDFDVDRTDFLLRTAYFAGLPYGKVDLDYLIGVLELHRMEHCRVVAIPPKAMRAAEHFLLGRFFDYQTVAFHKTVTAFERVLEDAIRYLLTHGSLACGEGDIEERIKSGHWAEFDDRWLLDEIKRWRTKPKGSNAEKRRFEKLADCVLHRHAPKLIGEVEFLAREDSEEASDFETKVSSVITEIEKEAGLKPELITWSNPGMKLTKLGSLTQAEEADRQDADQLVYLKKPDGSARALIYERRSLMHIISQYRWFCFRAYSLDRSEERVQKWRKRASEILRNSFGEDVVTRLRY